MNANTKRSSQHTSTAGDARDGRAEPEGAAMDVSPGIGDRFAGAVLGGAIGDALGAPVEFMSVEAIKRQYGAQGLEELPTTRGANGEAIARYTDDTQLAEVVLRSTLESLQTGESLDTAMRRLSGHFVHWMEHPQGGHRAPGNACMAGCRRLREGVKWSEGGGPNDGGCGSVMRAWPLGLLFAHEPERAEEWAVAQSRLTHNAPIALAACAAVARGIASLVRGESVEQASAEMIAAAKRWDKPTAAMIERAANDARTGLAPELVFDRLRAWAAHEAIAAATYLLLRHPNDYRAAALEWKRSPRTAAERSRRARSLEPSGRRPRRGDPRHERELRRAAWRGVTRLPGLNGGTCRRCG